MKIDMHCHSHHSRDSLCSPKDILLTAKKNGLDGIAITDHDSTDSWKEAEEVARTLGMVFIKAEEIKIKENNVTIGELLAYFITDHIDPKNKTTSTIIEEIKEQSGICIISHPFSSKKPFKKLDEYLKRVGGIEIFNSRSQSTENNERARLLAKKESLIFTAGSDAHTLFEIGNSYIESDADDLNSLKDDIINKKIKVIGKQSPSFLQIFSPISKTVHRFHRF
ncbi:MAG: PHP domain-containing protein [Candidatus Pacebacteria bacterium]|nr:PHP domain-containing protein [Candidatus Paceibacterota bacterium]